MSAMMNEIDPNDFKIWKDIVSKYPETNSENIGIVMIILQGMGFGRNSQTAHTLRALADIIDSPIKSSDRRWMD